MANPIVLIPARMHATRLPGKPLADINGAPMIVHVWRRAVAAGLGPVVVACGDREIAAAELFQGYFTTTLAADELIVEVRVPTGGPGHGSAFCEWAPRAGDFAVATRLGEMFGEPSPY